MPVKILLYLLSAGGVFFLASTFNMPLLLAELLIKFLRTLTTVTTAGGITASQDLMADLWAAELQGEKKHGISALFKLSRGNIGNILHVTTGFTFVVPASTVRERINALRRDP